MSKRRQIGAGRGIDEPLAFKQESIGREEPNDTHINSVIWGDMKSLISLTKGLCLFCLSHLPPSIAICGLNKIGVQGWD